MHAGTQMAKLFYYLIKHYGRAKTMSYLKRVGDWLLFLLHYPFTLCSTIQIAQTTLPNDLLASMINWNLARSEYQVLTTETSLKEGVVAEFDAIIDDAPEVPQMAMEQARAYAERLGANLASASQGHAFVNGKHFDMDDVSGVRLRVKYLS
jgi:UDP-glucose:glycoprotein glucosyltransferase